MWPFDKSRGGPPARKPPKISAARLAAREPAAAVNGVDLDRFEAPPARRVEPATRQLPSFRLENESGGRRPGDADSARRQARLEQLRAAFTPTQPQRDARLFAGRIDQLDRIIRAVEHERAHVVLYAERGRGKTSLSNMVAEQARAAGYAVARFACSPDSSFDTILRGLLRDLPSSMLASSARDDLDGRGEGCEDALPAGPVTPKDLVMLPGRLAASHTMLMIDEFDRVESDETRSRLADAIKHVSDRGAALTFFIIGVADNLERLLGQHPSIQRNVVGVALPLMKPEELGELIDFGAERAGITFAPDARHAISVLARGVPYIAQLLAMHAGRAAVERRSVVIEIADLEPTITQLVRDWDGRVAASFETAIRAHEGSRALIFAAAAGDLDEAGAFRVRAQQNATVVLGARRMSQHPQAAWDALVEQGMVRRARQTRPEHWVFDEATMMAYILLRDGALHLGMRTVVELLSDVQGAAAPAE